MSARDTPRMSREAESDDAADHRPAGGQRCENGHPCACVFENWSHGAIGQASSECCVHGEKECQPTPPVQEDGRDWWLLEVESEHHEGGWRVPPGWPVRCEAVTRREAAAWEEDGYRTRVTRLTPTPTIRAPEPERVEGGEPVRWPYPSESDLSAAGGALEWALDLIAMYDRRLAEIDGEEKVYTETHRAGMTKAHRALERARRAVLLSRPMRETSRAKRGERLEGERVFFRGHQDEDGEWTLYLTLRGTEQKVMDEVAGVAWRQIFGDAGPR